MFGTFGARVRWTPANLGLGIMWNREQGACLVFICGPVALFIGNNP